MEEKSRRKKKITEKHKRETIFQILRSRLMILFLIQLGYLNKNYILKMESTVNSIRVIHSRGHSTKFNCVALTKKQ